MNILAIDPGYEQSAWVLYDPAENRIHGFGKEPNAVVFSMLMLDEIKGYPNADAELVVEQIAAMGMTVGAEVFETVWWSGKFDTAWSICRERPGHRIKRLAVKMHLCHDSRAKDPNIRQALLDRFGPGREKAIGCKKAPGPLYGVSGDVWSALAVAVTWADTKAPKEVAPAVG